MIFLIIMFIAVATASCMKAKEQFRCADDAALILCLRAQDRTNWLIEKTNETMPPLFFNCSQHVISNGIEWQSRLGVDVYFSKENNAACYRAMQIFDNIVQKYALNNTLPIECEVIEGSKDYSPSSKDFLCSLVTLFAFIMQAV